MTDRRGEHDPLNRLRQDRESSSGEKPSRTSDGNTGNTASNTDSTSNDDNTISNTSSNAGSGKNNSSPIEPGGYLTVSIDKDQWQKLQVWLPPDLADRLDTYARQFGGSKSRALSYLIDQHVST